MRQLLATGAVAVITITLLIDNSSRAQSWSHEYIMPDGNSYLCGGSKDYSSCTELDKAGRKQLYEQRQKINDKHSYCSKVSDKARDDYNNSFAPDDMMRFVNPAPGWDAYRSCMNN